MKIDRRRFIFAVIEGAGNWIAVGSCLLLSTIAISYFGHLVPGEPKLAPPPVHAVNCFIPVDSTAWLYLVALPGLIWCSWLKPREPIHVLTSFYLALGFAFVASSSVGFLSISLLLDGRSSSPFYHIQTLGEALYVAFCFLPLIIAAISHRCRSDV